MKNSITMTDKKEMLIQERFALKEAFCDEIHSKKARFGFGGFGEATYYRTYSRIKRDGSQEHWPDTVIRVIDGVMSVRKNHYVMNRLAWDEERWQHYARRLADASEATASGLRCLFWSSAGSFSCPGLQLTGIISSGPSIVNRINRASDKSRGQVLDCEPGFPVPCAPVRRSWVAGGVWPPC